MKTLAQTLSNMGTQQLLSGLVLPKPWDVKHQWLTEGCTMLDSQKNHKCTMTSGQSTEKGQLFAQCFCCLQTQSLRLPKLMSSLACIFHTDNWMKNNKDIKLQHKTYGNIEH
jgi:hypothetical protein